jgi:hypothetical protein
MSSLVTYDTIEQYLPGQWAAACAAASLEVTPVIFENMPDELPDDPAHFVFVEIYGDFFDQASIGAETRAANLWREGRPGLSACHDQERHRHAAGPAICRPSD